MSSPLFQMRGRQDRPKQPTVKNMINPLGNTQYFSELEHLELDKNEGLLKDFTGVLPPTLLKKYHVIDHLSNTTVRLQAELDKALASGERKQTEAEQFRQKLSHLAQLQQEKLRIAVSALAELKALRNNLALRLFTEDKKQEQNVAEAVFQKDSTRPLDESLLFSYTDLIQNARAHAASGSLGNSLVLPSKLHEVQAFVSKLDLDSEEINARDFGPLTLELQPRFLCEQLDQLQAAFVSCLSGKLLVEQCPFVTQEEMVAHGFAELPLVIYDEATVAKYPNNDPKPRANVQEKQQALKSNQERFKNAAKTAEMLMNRQDEKKNQRQRVKLGEIIQNGCLPLFSVVEQPSAESSFAVPSMATSQMQPAQLLEHSVLIEEEPDQIVIETAQPVQNEFYNARYCLPRRCASEDESDMVQCERGERCRWALEGWFHPICLGFDEGSKAFEGVEFWCPGCWVDTGRAFSDWGEDFKVTKKRITGIRKELQLVWSAAYGQQLRK